MKSEKATKNGQAATKRKASEDAVSEQNEQKPAAQESAPVVVDPMDFLEGTPTVHKTDATTMGDNGTRREVVTHLDPPLEQIAGQETSNHVEKHEVATESKEVIVVTDCNAKNLPVDLKEAIAQAAANMNFERAQEISHIETEIVASVISEQLRSGDAALEVGWRQGAGGKMEPEEVSVVPAPKRTETLHAPHGTTKPVTQAAKPKAKAGCKHGFYNPTICPQCRASGAR